MPNSAVNPLQKLIAEHRPQLLIQAQLDVLTDAMTLVSAFMQQRPTVEVGTELREMMAERFAYLSRLNQAGGEPGLPPEQR